MARMLKANVPAILTADPINILYGCGARNMTVFGMMGPSRLMLLFADGPCVLFEFAGCEHLAAGLETVTHIVESPGFSYTSGPSYVDNIDVFATQIAELLHRYGGEKMLAVERLDFLVTDAFRARGIALRDATPIFQQARSIKASIEIDVMREAIRRVESASVAFQTTVAECRTENATWAELHRGLIASDGEYISTRLVQSGPRTFPYFQESSDRKIQAGELVCLDTDCLGWLGYGVDYSRTYVAGGVPPTPRQRELHAASRDQLDHNASLLAPGKSFEDFARNAFDVPTRFRPYGYYCLGHGLGLSGEYPNIPLAAPGIAYSLPGAFEPGMVICIESYIGDSETHQGVKLEDQFLITETGAERLSNSPFGIE